MFACRLFVLLFLASVPPPSAAIGFAVYKDRPTRLVEEGIVSPLKDGLERDDRYRSTMSQPGRLPGRLGAVLDDLFEKKILKIARLCQQEDARAEVSQMLTTDTTYECILAVIREAVPPYHRYNEVNSTHLVKALCLHPRKLEQCYEAGLGPILRRCLSGGETQVHESLMFLWEKTGNAICHTLFGDGQQVPQNAVIRQCLRSRSGELTGCLASFFLANKDLPHLTHDTARATAPRRCRNMVDLMRCSVGVFEDCNDPNLSRFASAVFHKTFDYTSCNTTESVLNVTSHTNGHGNAHLKSSYDSSATNILAEVIRILRAFPNSAAEPRSAPSVTESNSTVVKLTSRALHGFGEDKVVLDDVFTNENIPTGRDSYQSDYNGVNAEVISTENEFEATLAEFSRLDLTAIGEMNFLESALNNETIPTSTGGNSSTTTFSSTAEKVSDIFLDNSLEEQINSTDTVDGEIDSNTEYFNLEGKDSVQTETNSTIEE